MAEDILPATEPTPEPNAARRPWELFSSRQRWAMLAVLFLVMTVSNIDRQIMTVALEPIKAEYGATDTEMGLLSGLAFAMFYVLLGLPIARWADRGNRKLIISASIAFWSLMTAACGLAQNFAQMFVTRLAVGIGEAGALPTSHSLIGDYFPPDNRGRAIAIFVMSGAVGYGAALIGGSYIASQMGWRSMFVIFGLSSLVTALLAGLVLREPRHILPPAEGADHGERYGPAIAGLLRKRSFRWLLAGTAFYGVVCYGALIFVVSHLVRSFGLSLTRAGMIYGVISTITALFGALVGGYLTDRMARSGPASVPGLTALLSLAAMPAYLLAFATGNLVLFTLAMLVGGCLLFAAAPPLYASFHIVSASRRRATAIALLSVMMNLVGLGGGPALTGILSDMFGAVHGPALGLRIAMLISVGALLPVAACFFAARRTIERDADQ